MYNVDVMFAQHLSPEHVFVAVVAETLIEGMVDEYAAVDEEVAGVEIVIGMGGTLLGTVIESVCLFVTVAEIER